nr:MAG TPA: hypothetical protein [Caudoviricetes sp.]
MLKAIFYSPIHLKLVQTDTKECSFPAQALPFLLGKPTLKAPPR